MAIYGSMFSNEDDNKVLSYEYSNVYNPKMLEEMFLVEELENTLTQDEIKEFIESAECKAMLESGDISTGSVMYLSKIDDLTRRTNVAALQMSRSAGDSLYAEFEKIMKKKDDILAKIYRKYAVQAKKDAKTAQREFIKKVPNRFRRRITIS